MVLVWLDKVEISTFSGSKSVMTVELKLGINDGVISTIRTRSSTRIGEISPSVSISSSYTNRTNIGVKLRNPYKFLTRVVEVETLTNRGLRERFRTTELKFFNEIFVTNLGELTTFIGVKEDVINP